MLVNKRDLADVFDTSEQSLTNWQREGMPVKALAEKRGQSNLYDTGEVHRWLLARAMAKVGGGDGETYVYEAERARLTFHQANLAALDESVKRGNLIPAETVAAEWADIVGRCRSKLLALPSRLAPKAMSCATVRECEDFARAEVYAALNDLSNDIAGPDDAEGDSAGGGDATEAAAAADGEPVG